MCRHGNNMPNKCVTFAFVLRYIQFFIKTFNNQYLSKGIITKLPNSEQSSKGKVKTLKYINRQNQSTTGKLGKP